MRKVCRLAREVLDIAARELRPGVTTDYIDEVVHKACIERNVSIDRKFLRIKSQGTDYTTLVLSITSKLCQLP